MTDPEQLKADIQATRAELAETADALAAKLDVKAQANHQLHAAGDRVAARYRRAKDACPASVQKVIAKIEQAARPVLAKAAADPRRTAFVGAGSVVVVLVVRKARRRRPQVVVTLTQAVRPTAGRSRSRRSSRARRPGRPTPRRRRPAAARKRVSRRR